jgi:hypothetical protein
VTWKPDYVTVDDLREYMTKSAVEITEDETTFARAVTAASRAVDRHTRRQFGLVAAAAARQYTAIYSGGYWVVPIDDLMTVTGLVVEVDTAGDNTYATEVTAPGYVLRPRNADADGKPWTKLAFTANAEAYPTGVEGGVQVTAKWGWSTVPTTVELATLLQASRLFVRRESPYGVAGSPSDGSEMRLLSRLDPDVAVMLKDYEKRAQPR